MPNRKAPGDQVRSFRKSVAQLKAKGLLSKRVDARKQAPTRYMRGQVKRFADVLSGKAAVVKVPRAQAKEFSDRYQVKGGRVAVPIRKGEKLAYSAKNQEITASSKVAGKRVRRRMAAGTMSRDRAPISGNVLYTIPLGNSRQSFDTWGDLVLFMEPYETQAQNPYRDWEKYVEIIDYEDDGDE